MTIPYSSGKSLSIDQLTNVNITDIANNDLLQYNSTNGVWENGSLDLSGQDINVDEIDCRVLRVSETADITGRLANQGVASFVNDEFIFQNGVSNLGDTLYIDNVNNAIGINGENYGTAGQVLTSGGSGSAVSWTTPSAGGGITQYATFTYQPTTEQIVSNTFTALQYDTVNTTGGSDIILDATNNVGRITLATTGVYMINYYSTGYVYTQSGRVITECMIFVNPNTGTFTEEVGTGSFCYLRQSSDPENTSGISYLLNVSASNTQIELRFKTADLVNRAKMKSKYCGITITKIA